MSKPARVPPMLQRHADAITYHRMHGRVVRHLKREADHKKQQYEEFQTRKATAAAEKRQATGVVPRVKSWFNRGKNR